MTLSTPQNFRHPVLEYDEELKLWRLVENYTFIWDDPKTKRMERLHIPAGEVYDKASVPRALWSVARPDGPWEGPALFHDILYKKKGDMGDMYHVADGGKWVLGPKWSRWRADWFLGWTGKLGGASYLGASKYTWAVRLYPPNFFKGF